MISGTSIQYWYTPINETLDGTFRAIKVVAKGAWQSRGPN